MKLAWTLTIEFADGTQATCDVTERDFTPTQLAALEHIARHRGQAPAPPAEHVGSPEPAGMNRQRSAAQREAAKAAGYVGEMCHQCGSFNTKRNGSCLCCDSCGTTTGCS